MVPRTKIFMNNLYPIIELLYQKNTGFNVEFVFIDDDKNVVKRKCKYASLFLTEDGSQQ